MLLHQQLGLLCPRLYPRMRAGLLLLGLSLASATQPTAPLPCTIIRMSLVIAANPPKLVKPTGLERFVCPMAKAVCTNATQTAARTALVALQSGS